MGTYSNIIPIIYIISETDIFSVLFSRGREGGRERERLWGRAGFFFFLFSSSTATTHGLSCSLGALEQGEDFTNTTTALSRIRDLPFFHLIRGRLFYFIFGNGNAASKEGGRKANRRGGSLLLLLLLLCARLTRAVRRPQLQVADSGKRRYGAQWRRLQDVRVRDA